LTSPKKEDRSDVKEEVNDLKQKLNKTLFLIESDINMRNRSSL